MKGSWTRLVANISPLLPRARGRQGGQCLCVPFSDEINRREADSEC